MKQWKLKYKNSKIEVVKESRREILYINGKVHDDRFGIIKNISLYGKLPSGENVKVKIDDILDSECKVFIDNELIEFKNKMK